MRTIFMALFVLTLLAGPSLAAPIPDADGKITEESPVNEDHVVGEEMC